MPVFKAETLRYAQSDREGMPQKLFFVEQRFFAHNLLLSDSVFVVLERALASEGSYFRKDTEFPF